MRRYDLKILLRTAKPDPDCPSVKIVRSRVTADSEYDARRVVLERAWAQGLLVSQFLSVQRRELL